MQRILLNPSNDNEFKFKREQFLIHLCFTMTINKSKEQIISNVEIYLPRILVKTTKIWIKPVTIIQIVEKNNVHK